MDRKNNDNNIYKVYGRLDRKGNYQEPLYLEYKGIVTDLSKHELDVNSFIEQMIENDPNFVELLNNGEINVVNRVEPRKQFSKMTVSENLKRMVAGATGAAIVLVATGITGYFHLKKYQGKDNTSLISQEVLLEDLTLEKNIKNNVITSISYFNNLASKYAIEEKQLGITAEEWLTGYIYTNSYDYTIQELLDLLKDNPDFYSKLSDNYRKWCKTQTMYNVIADEPCLTKHFIKSEEAYNIYIEYFNLYKETRNNPTKENKKKLDDFTKEIYGLKGTDEDKNSIWKKYPGIASVIGYTLVTAAEQQNIITNDTYDAAMGIYNYDKNGDLIETHGPIEWTTCEMIENERLKTLNLVVLSSDVKVDELTDWFKENNKHYDILVSEDKLLSEQDYLDYLNRLLEEKYNSNYKKGYSNTVKTESKTEQISKSEAISEFGSGAVAAAKQGAYEEFKKDYSALIAEQEAKKNGLINANNEIEKILAEAKKNQSTADSYSKETLEALKNKLKENYNGSNSSYYGAGIDEAISSGLNELINIQKQYDEMDNKIKEQPTSSTNTNSETSSNQETNDYFVPTTSSEIEYTQEELEELQRVRG